MEFKRKRIFRNVVTALVLVLAMGLCVVSFAEESGVQAEGESNHKVSYFSTSLSSIERDLNDDYEKYKEGYRDLEFDYDLSESSSTVTVKMEAKNFKRTSTEWEKRDSDKFHAFLKEIGAFITADREKTVKINLDDKDGKETAKYVYSFEASNEYGEDDDDDDDDGEELKDVTDDLNDDYKKYTKGLYNLEFKYKVTESSREVKVDMTSTNFDKSSTKWDRRNSSKFRDFVKDVAEKVAKDTNEDVRIELEDKNGKELGEYTYDESSKKFDVVSEDGKDDDDDDDVDVNDIEKDLNDDFDEYDKGRYELRFEYDVKDYSKEVKVKMEGTNFDKGSSKWDKRDDDEFEDFVKDIAKKVAKDADKDVKIELEDKDGKEIATYTYDESSKKFKVDDDDDDDDDDDADVDKIEDKLNDKYDEYDDGKYDLEFEYDVKDSSREVKVDMEGKNFEYDSKEWEKRDTDKFHKFVEKIAEYVAEEAEKDVEIKLEDEDGKSTGEYTYDEGKEKFKVVEEEGEEEVEDVEDIEKYLNDEFEEYDDDKDLEFKYSLDEKGTYVKVEMRGRNFEKKDDAWEDRDKDDFEDFVEEIAEYTAEKSGLDVRVYVYDDDKEDLLRCDYDEEDEEFEVVKKY